MILKDKKFRLPREWSNRELLKFSYLFKGKVINISGWKDLDKEGNFYRNYFINCKEYHISNHPELGKGFQNFPNEIKLDLEQDLDQELVQKFDIVFNHTTLEHTYDFKKGLKNLCLLTKDIIILIVPFIQLEHGEGFNDFWRFTPTAIKYLFRENGLKILYLNYNEHKRTSVYIFCIASKNPNKWENKFKNPPISRKKVWLDTYHNRVGSRAIINNLLFRIKIKILSIFKKDLFY